MIVVDTNVLSEPLRSRPDEAVLDWLEASAENVSITAITVGEMLVGARSIPHGRRREGLLEAIDQTVAAFGGEVLVYDARAARAYAEMREIRTRMGRALSVEDGMIAGICASHGAALATRNTKDFIGLGIELIDPWLRR